jgi:hypothetical protein
VRSFIGHAGYYRRFIEGFSWISHPITSLQKKVVKFGWTSEYEEICLNNLLTSEPILKISNPNEYFIMCIDSCKEGLGGVLIQNGHVIFYESGKLKEHERNSSTYALELVAIVHVLNMWRHYLMIK